MKSVVLIICGMTAVHWRVPPACKPPQFLLHTVANQWTEGAQLVHNTIVAMLHAMQAHPSPTTPKPWYKMSLPTKYCTVSSSLDVVCKAAPAFPTAHTEWPDFSLFIAAIPLGPVPTPPPRHFLLRVGSSFPPSLSSFFFFLPSCQNTFPPCFSLTPPHQL